MSPLKKREFALPLSFVLFRSSVDCLMPTYVEKGLLFHSADRFQMLITSGNTLTDT